MAATKRGRKPTIAAKEETNGASGLLAALKFVGVAQRKDGTHTQMHCVLYNGFATSCDGLLTIGCPIAADLNCVPNTLKLIDALQKCKEQISITQLDSGRLSIKSGKFRALVECQTFDQMPYVGPDQNIAKIDDRIKQGLEAVSMLADEAGRTVIEAAVLLQANTCAATNRLAMLEYMHGIDLPPNLLLPKAAVKAICGTAKKLSGFGYTQHQSATFYFEDGSYIKTQLFADTFPDLNKFYDRQFNLWPLPEGFFEAVAALESFTEKGIVFFNEGVIASNPRTEDGASYEVEALPVGMAFNAELLLTCKHAFKQVQFDEKEMRVFAFADNLRCVVMGCRR